MEAVSALEVILTLEAISVWEATRPRRLSVYQVNFPELASDFEIEILNRTLERLNIPKYNLKMEENPMVEAVSTPVETTALDIVKPGKIRNFQKGQNVNKNNKLP